MVASSSLIWSRKASLTSLSYELLELIISFLPTHIPAVQCDHLREPIVLETKEFSERRQAVLLSLSQVSRELRAVALSLWRDVEFVCADEASVFEIADGENAVGTAGRKKEETDERHKWLSFFPWEREIAVSMARYLNAMAVRGVSYGGRVQTMTLIFTPYSCTPIFKLLVNALSNMPNLHTLQLHVSFCRKPKTGESTGHTCNTAFHSLLSKELSNVAFPQIRALSVASELWEFIPSCPNLEHLHFLNFFGMKDDFKIGTRSASGIRDAQVKRLTGMIPPDMLKEIAFLDFSRKTLESIELHFSYDKWITIELTYIKLLRRCGRQNLRLIKIFPGKKPFPLSLEDFEPSAITSRQLDRMEGQGMNYARFYEIGIRIAYSVLSHQISVRAVPRPTKLIWVRSDGTQVVLCEDGYLDVGEDIDNESHGEREWDGDESDEEDGGEGARLSQEYDQPVLMVYETNAYATSY